MFDFFSPVTDFLGTIAQWIGYGIIATFVVGALFLLVALPIGMKIAAVAFARILVVETTNLLAKSGVAVQVSNAVQSVTVAANTITEQLQENKIQKSEFKVIEVKENEEVM